MASRFCWSVKNSTSDLSTMSALRLVKYSGHHIRKISCDEAFIYDYSFDIFEEVCILCKYCKMTEPSCFTCMKMKR